MLIQTFQFKRVVPASQIDKSNTSYFDLKLNPGQSETLTFNLRNTANKAIVVDVAKGTATTTDGGAVDYAGNGPFDKSLRIKSVNTLTHLRPSH